MLKGKMMFNTEPLLPEAQLENVRQKWRTRRVSAASFTAGLVGLLSILHLSANSNVWDFLGTASVMAATTYVCYLILKERKEEG